VCPAAHPPRCRGAAPPPVRSGRGRSRAGRSRLRTKATTGRHVRARRLGYVDLGGELLVETRLTENEPERLEIGAELELVLIPLYREEDGTEVLTYAFRPQERNG
jgi:hypothetical protein